MYRTISLCWGPFQLDVEGDYSPAEAETPPSYASGGDPAVDEDFQPVKVLLVMPVWQRKGREHLPFQLDVTDYVDDFEAIRVDCLERLEDLE